MDTMKKFTVGLLVIVLLIAECIFMGVLALDFGSGPRSVRDALTKSQIVAEITEDSIRSQTVNMGGLYGEMMEEIMATEAMTDFFTEYVSEGIRSIIYQREYEEIATDELLRAFDKGVDQVNEEGKYNISPDLRKLLMEYAEQTAPDLTQSLNKTMAMYQAAATGTAEEAAQTAQSVSAIAPLLSTASKGIMLLVIIGIGAALYFLSGRRAKGIVWTAVATIAAGAIYGGLAYRGIGTSDETARQFLDVLIKDGATISALICGIAGVLLLIFSIVVKLRQRRSFTNLK